LYVRQHETINNCKTKEVTMINLARQAFANPFLPAVGASFQPGQVSSIGTCPCCGNTVAVASPIQPQTAGLNPLNIGQNLGQQIGGLVPNPYAVSQTTGFGQINPLSYQFTPGVPQAINPFVAQLASNWAGNLPHQGVDRRFGVYGADPRFGFGTPQQLGYNDPTAVPASINPAFTGDPIGSLYAQHVNPLAQQQLPIRPLIGGQQGLGSQSQSFIPGFASPTTQWADPIRMLIEAQLISQIASNPFYQLQRAYGGVPDATGQGMPFAGQQLNPLFANVPFYG
jgi:hypothetical protein